MENHKANIAMADEEHALSVLDNVSEAITMKGSRTVRFPVRLHFILEDVERSGLSDVISWLPDGKSFKIHHRKRFIAEVIPKYFNAATFKSFQRNFHVYGFNTVSKGKYKGVVSHPDFVRGDVKRCATLQRVFGKGRPCETAARSRMQQMLIDVASKEKAESKEQTQSEQSETSPEQRRKAITSMTAVAANTPKAPSLGCKESTAEPASVPSEPNVLAPQPSHDDIVKSCADSMLALAQEHEREREEMEEQLVYLQAMIKQQVALQAEQKRQLMDGLTAELGLPIVQEAIESMLEPPG